MMYRHIMPQGITPMYMMIKRDYFDTREEHRPEIVFYKL